MSSDERPENLATQAAAWVPPWERRRAADGSEPVAATDSDEPDQSAVPSDAAMPGATDPAPGGEAPTELPPLPGEVATPPTVDAPQPLPDDDGVDPLGPAIAVPDAPPLPRPHEPTGPDDAPDSAPVDAPVDLRHRTPAPADQLAGSAPAQTRGSRDAVPAAAAAERRTAEEAGSDGQSATDSALDDDGELRAALEAILLVVDEPVADVMLAQILRQPTARVAAALEEISAGYTAAGNGFDLRRAAGGWRLYTRPEYAEYVERFVLDGQSTRLTQAALETLAVVAYKQPVTRSRISAIRGVNCDGVMRTLVSRGLIEECGTEPETGAFLYRTTTLFLEKLGLNSVDQLPALAPFLPDDLEEVLDAQR